MHYAREAGWILNSQMVRYGRAPESWSGDGILSLLVPARPDLIEFVRSADAPVVDLAPDVDLPKIAGRVLLENERIGELAAAHLFERRFRNLAFFQYNDNLDVQERSDGFCRAVETAGGEFFHLDWPRAQANHGDSFSWLVDQISRLPHPVGIFAQSDHRAVRVLEACGALGLRVPEQVAVIGVDNDEFCQFAPVGISSVDSNRFQQGYQAARELDRLMAGGEPAAAPIRIPPRDVVVRRSSEILAVEHPQVAAALGYIWQNFRRPISVDNVIAVTTMSRCGLYRAFEKYIGHTIAAEISRKRLDAAKELLRHSDEKLYQVAVASGFTNAEHLSRVFRRIVGMTPSEFRSQ